MAATPPPPPPPKNPPKPKAKTPPTPAGGKQKPAARTPKSYTIVPWTGEGEGHKVIGYGASGRGKTTLAASLPKAVFIGADDGGRKIINPNTSGPLNFVPGVEDFDDLRECLAAPGLFDDYDNVVIDTVTRVEQWAADWTCANIKHEKGHGVSRLVDYGYGKGYEHLYDTMRLLFADLDTLVRQGKNIILLAQQCPVVIANAGGSDYLEDGPKLYHPGKDSKQTFSIRSFACEWADHVFRIDYNNRMVGDDGKVKGDTERAVFIVPENPSYIAKSRTLGNLRDEDGKPITRLAFENPADDSLWRWLFPEQYDG